MKPVFKIILLTWFACSALHHVYAQENKDGLDIPDELIRTTYEKAATQNVLAAVNPAIFDGYFSVCADGVGFGYGNTYPSLDGHQMSDALLWLGKIDVVKANWAYVKTFQKPKGELPLAIIPAEAGKNIGPAGFQSAVDPNGGLYKHWVPGDPLRALAGVTYIQNADIIFRFTQDKTWLAEQLASVNLTADYLVSMITPEGAVAGAGYYVERPTRVEYDGVSQCHVADALYRLSALNKIAGNNTEVLKYLQLAKLVEANFRNNFWVSDHFAEYIHPQKGKIATHGLTDVDWSALATGSATAAQQAILWPRLKKERLFYYNGMPTGIATLPGTYEKWETTYADNQDLAAMGRVWYIEAWARANMHDGNGLIETIRRVCKEGRDSGYYWRERYNAKGGYGAKKYNEYPANLVRIIQRFLLGVEHGLDGTLSIAPTVPEAFWKSGFGQTISWNSRTISYRMGNSGIKGTYSGAEPQKIAMRFGQLSEKKRIKAMAGGTDIDATSDEGWISVALPPAPAGSAINFEIKLY